MIKFYILTDLEGVAGTDRFTQTRTSDSGADGKGPSMKQLGREVNACVEGIKAVYPDAVIDVWDGHGSYGLFPEDLVGCNYQRDYRPHTGQLHDYAAMLFVGQHAMAGTINAPLCHTYSSREVMYYRLNGVYIGEFGARAFLAGVQSVPTIFLSGDDKAALEAKMFVPEIETVVTKQGTGFESAIHLDQDESCRLIRQGAERAVRRMQEIAPFTGFTAPYTFEARHYNKYWTETRKPNPKREYVDDYTYRIVSDDIFAMPF
ncbi:MAG: peptidase D-aminopeptidase [Paenibacillus sp.]|jgi:D-amino peptidase|nr:peptidase D-aminopeptidase [Paenibacillus sp.]